ncbi:LysR family transcriptional regulator [uncultured Clostridium sp.]|uniref:LysR family transcriptional regulator n=1 Tax=uncultured Clostridium sp. TaxID=59620 RepID=UPI0025F9CCDE|nr:LysR family transcriptional regulator [uncultured Clostridium sp.]
MDIKQLKYFIIVADCGSINKAAEELFTSQPNVSKVISSLEKEVGIDIFYRNSKGVRMTEKGEELYDYAQRILENVDMIMSISSSKYMKKLNISSYPSHIVSRVFCDYYKKNEFKDLKVQFLEGSIEEIIENVKGCISEIGIVYIIEQQKCCFNHTLEHKNMEFIKLETKKACIYAGKNSSIYNKNSISIHELLKLKFVQSTKDFFSVEQYLEKLYLVNKSENNRFDRVVTTNSDHAMIDLLINTDLCSVGVKFMNDRYNQYDIRAIDIDGYTYEIYLGYIKRKGEILSNEAQGFIDLLDEIIRIN